MRALLNQVKSACRALWTAAAACALVCGSVGDVSGSLALVYQTNSVSGGNGNGLIDYNECNDLQVVVRNLSGGSVTGVVAVLHTTNAFIQITHLDAPYPEMAPGQDGTNSHPFKISSVPWLPGGIPIHFTLMLTNADGLLGSFSFSTDTATNSIGGSGPCPMILGGGLFESDSLQRGRLIRSGNPSDCTGPWLAPSNWVDFSVRRFDAYTFTNPNSNSTCVAVTLDAGCDVGSFPLFSVAYLNSYSPINLRANYLGDIGDSPDIYAPLSYSFTVPPSSLFVVVVHEVDWNAPCSSYTLSVSSDNGFVEYVPAIRLARQDSVILLSWPTNTQDFQLEGSTNLMPGSFVAVTNHPATVGDNWRLTNSTLEPGRLFRLRKP